MNIDACCASPDLAWKSSRAGNGQWADEYACHNCGTVHRSETWFAPVFPEVDDCCLNCGGTRRRGTCTTCGLDDAQVRDLHDRLAALHPEGDYLAAALAASEVGRNVLALKLASAAAAWGQDHDAARALRLQSLEGMGEIDRALDEAYAWTHSGNNPEVWRIVADLEAAGGNTEGALQALERSLELDHLNLETWTDYAELLNLIDSRPNAIEAAAYGIADDDLRPRSIAILRDIAERYYRDGEVKDALGAVSHAGDWQAYDLGLAWLRAQIMATQNNLDEAVKWLDITLRLDPNHSAARSALEALRPQRKKGLFGLFGGGKG